MATFQIPFGFAEELRPADREPAHIEQARALAREAESSSRVTLALPAALSRSVARAAADEGLSVADWLVRVAARTVFNPPTAA